MPSIFSTSGTWSHYNTGVSVTGTGFGTRASGSPAIWDDCSGTSVLDLWDGKWPTVTGANELTYRAAQRSIPMPHSRVSKYMCGTHYPNDTSNDGANVIPWKNRTISSYPAYTYISWYSRLDDGWTFGQGSPADDNLKLFAVSKSGSPYELPDNYYIAYDGGPPNSTSNFEYAINDDNNTCGGGGFGFCNLQDPDANGQDHWWGTYQNPFGGIWQKLEIEIKYDSTSAGYMKMWQNNVLKIDYVGRTKITVSDSITEGPGGFARSIASTNWRYFADLYMDEARSRAVLGDASTLSACTIIEPQILTAWSDTSITLKVNLGKLADTGTAYLYVYGEDGTWSSGFAITLSGSGGGGGGEVSLPNPPSKSSRRLRGYTWTR